MNWIITKLKDLPINIIDGDRSAKYPKREEFCAEGVAFLNSTNISGNTLDLSEVNFITNEKFAQINKGRFQGGDILMTTRGSIGKVAWVRHGFHGLINAQMLILRANPEALESRFLFSLLSSAESQQTLKNFASGSAQPQIPIRDLREIEVRVPPVGIQRRIAAILSAYDDLIENNTRRIAILEEMASRIYEEWFVRFRFPGHEGVRMVESELGLVPQGWNFAAVQDVMETHGGGTPSKTEPGYWTDGQVNWYSPTDLTRAKTVFMGESSNKITDLGLSKSSAKLFPSPAYRLSVSRYGSCITGSKKMQVSSRALQQARHSRR